MGHGSWFSHLFPGLYAEVVELMHSMGGPFNDEGTTWTGFLGQKADIAANEGHGAQALLHVLFVTLLLGIFAFVSYSKVKDTKSAIIPEDKLSIRTFVELVVNATYGMMK